MRANDIVFFNVHRRYIDQSPAYGGFLGIYVLAAFVNANGYQAQAFDGTLHAGCEIIDELCQGRKVRMVGLYCDYANVTENQYLSQYIKAKYQLPVIVGGPQATSLKAIFIQKAQCDAIVRYEGELTVLELMDFFLDGTGSLSKILGIAYWYGNQLVVNQERPVIENLDALPIIDEMCYLRPRKNPYELSIMTGRGCPFHCAFCHEGHHTRKVRFRSVNNVLEEIDSFLEKQSDNDHCYILFTDDTFTLDTQRVHELCQGLKERRHKHNFHWFCEGHIHTLHLHPEMIMDIVDAGVQRIQLGIEAGTQVVLDAYHKNTTLEEIKEVVIACRDAGVQQIYGNIILGSAFFSKDIYEQDLAFGKELLALGEGTVELGVISYWPLPETSMTNSPEVYDLKIVDRDFFTSVDDFPQTETETLDRWDILMMIQHMEQEFAELRKKMLIQGEVPLDRILSWYPRNNAFKSYGMWWQSLLALPNLYAYGHLLSLGEAVTFSNIEADWENARPMRVIPLNKYLIIKDNRTAEISGVELSSLEREVLVLSTGRNNIAWIYRYVQCLDSLLTLDKVMEVFKKLEAMYLIVYMKE